jgi:hypothetical protein
LDLSLGLHLVAHPGLRQLLGHHLNGAPTVAGRVVAALADKGLQEADQFGLVNQVQDSPLYI